MEKKYKGLVVLVVILSVFVFVLGGYVVYDKVLKDDKPSVDNLSGDYDDKNEDAKYEFLLKEYKDYTFVDHTKQDTFELGHTVSYEDVKEFSLMDSYKNGVTSTLYIKYDSSKKMAYFEMDNQKYYINIVDVKNVYAYREGCSNGMFIIYLLTYRGEVYQIPGNYKDFIDPATLVDDYILVNNTKTFEKLGRVVFNKFSTCGPVSSQIGVDVNGVEYYVDLLEKFDDDYAYYFGFYDEIAVKTNGEIYKLNGENYKSINVSVKKLIADNDKEFLFVDSNGYLGFIGYDGAIFLGYEKPTNKKVNSVFVKIVEDKTYLHVVYEDSAAQDFEF